MKKIIYILKYQDGDYVQRDDSTGPMSSGGYPQRVRSIDDATKWNTLEDAARYGNTSGFREFVRGVFPLEVRYAEMPMVEFPIFWETCNHHCLPSKESQAFGALHYLDCTLRKDSQ